MTMAKAQEEALKKLGKYSIIQTHDDGDLTVKSAGKLYVVTTDGKTFTDSCTCKRPSRDDVEVDIWKERDRLSIVIRDKETQQITYADWWDDEARQMFEDGFFVSGKGSRALEESVLKYAEEVGILEK